MTGAAEVLAGPQTDPEAVGKIDTEFLDPAFPRQLTEVDPQIETTRRSSDGQIPFLEKGTEFGDSILDDRSRVGQVFGWDLAETHHGLLGRSRGRVDECGMG